MPSSTNPQTDYNTTGTTGYKGETVPTGTSEAPNSPFLENQGPAGELNPDVVAEGFTPVYRDVKMCIFFLFNLIVGIGLTVYCGLKADYNDLFEDQNDDSYTPAPTISDDSIDLSVDVKKYLGAGIALFVGTIIFSLFMAYGSLKMLKYHTKCMLYTAAGVNLTMAVLLFIVTGSFYFAIVVLLTLLVYSFVFYRNRNSLEFGIWVIQTCCTVIEKHPSMFCVALVWTLFSGVVVSGLIFGVIVANNVLGLGGLIYVLVVAYWVEETMTNILGVTMGSVTANWALNLQTISSTAPVSTSFMHSITYALGSIAFGSLIVAILRLMRTIARSLASGRNQNAFAVFLALCCMCIVGCLEGLARWFNEWAYAYVALKQKDFLTSAQSVYDLFITNGWEAIKNDYITGIIIGLPPFVSLISAGVIVGLIAGYGLKWSTLAAVLAGIVAGIVAMFLVALVMGLIDRAQNVIFLSYLEDRPRFVRCHPEVVTELESRLKKRFPDITNLPDTASV